MSLRIAWRSINDQDMLCPKSLFRNGIEDETVAAERVGHDLEAIAPCTVIEDRRDEPVGREFARAHAPEIEVRASVLEDRPSIDEGVAKSRLGLLEREPEVLKLSHAVSHDDLTGGAASEHVTLEELSLNSDARAIPSRVTGSDPSPRPAV
jgi:hypothetical protein